MGIKYILRFLIGLFLFIILINISFISDQILLIIDQFNYSGDHILQVYELGHSSRLIAAYGVFSQEIIIFGKGLYEFHNPYSENSIDMNIFSQFHWFYEDLGVIGLILAILLLNKIRIDFLLANYQYYNFSQILALIIYFGVANIMIDPQFIIIFMLINAVHLQEKLKNSLLKI